MQKVVDIVLNNTQLDFFDIRNVACLCKDINTIVTTKVNVPSEFHDKLYITIMDYVLSQRTSKIHPMGFKISIKGKKIAYYTTVSSMFIYDDQGDDYDNFSQFISSMFDYEMSVGFLYNKNDQHILYFNDKNNVDIFNVDNFHQHAHSILSMFKLVSPFVQEIDIHYKNVDMNNFKQLLNNLFSLTTQFMNNVSININKELPVESILLSVLK
uniref:Uncharacterized protein n=1 Tax=viral metagenome TaxID=1070528 RepID=A0A6C0BEH7_9ZZZZ